MQVQEELLKTDTDTNEIQLLAKNTNVVTNAAENTCGDLLTHFECNFPKSLFSQGTTVRGSILLLPNYIFHFVVFSLLVFLP